MPPTPAASVVRSVPSFVHERLQEKLNDPARRKRYEEWCHNSETREMAELLKEVFCRPVNGPVDPNSALWFMAYNSGAWDVLEAMVELKPDRPEAAPAKQDYTGGDATDDEVDDSEDSDNE